MKIKRVLSAIITIITFTFIALNTKEQVILPPISDDIEFSDPFFTYNIGVCISESTANANYIYKGFYDAVEDFGIMNNYEFNIEQYTSQNENEAERFCHKLVLDEASLIYAIGKDSLRGALIATSELPIVMSGIIDYSDFVYTTPQGDSIRNFTGVSALPNTEFLLSTLIECTPKLEAVALLYNTQDSDAIYQNELLEKMLTQANIPWKEYEITPDVFEESSPIDTDSNSQEPENADESNITDESDIPITLRSPQAASSKEGANFDIEVLGSQDMLSGINEPESVRAPKHSANWSYNPKRIRDELQFDEEYEDDSDFSSIIRRAAYESSCIFIPKGSFLSPNIEEISSMALSYNTSTISNDLEIGKHTLCCTYSDSYDQGYNAGLKACSVLIHQTPPEDEGITNISWEKSTKLYNKDLADKYEMEFPKSFMETFSFSSFHTEGYSTVRLIER